jgi:hypothetical protein
MTGWQAASVEWGKPKVMEKQSLMACLKQWSGSERLATSVKWLDP